MRNMKTVKMISFYLLLASILYVGTGFISPSDGRGFSIASLCWAFFFMLFVGSDLWLHHKISRLIALALLALAYLMSFEYYWFCEEYRLTLHINSNERICLASADNFYQYWFCQSLLVCYLLLAIEVSNLLIRKKLLTKQANTYNVPHPTITDNSK